MCYKVSELGLYLQINTLNEMHLNISMQWLAHLLDSMPRQVADDSIQSKEGATCY